MRVQYARLETKDADIGKPFGLEWATKLFGQEVIDQLPRYVRGPKKGEIKAYVFWEKCTVGGWVRGQGVMTPGMNQAWIGPWGASSREAFVLNWGGRAQPVCGSRSYLFASGRNQMRREAIANAEWQIENALADLEEVIVARDLHQAARTELEAGEQGPEVQAVLEILRKDLEKDERRIKLAAESVVKWEATLAALPEADEPEETKECAA